MEVSDELIRLTPDLAMEMPRSRVPCHPGLQFGSLYPADPRKLTLHDFLPDQQLRAVRNLHEFAGMLVFDKWTCNTNGRQTVFLRDLTDARPGSDPIGTGYKTLMIDQGFCFNAGEWNFPDAPLRGLYARNRVYESVTGMESFGPWIARAENLTDRALGELAREIPPQWYEDDYDALSSRAVCAPEFAVAGPAVGSQEQQPPTLSQLEMRRMIRRHASIGPRRLEVTHDGNGFPGAHAASPCVRAPYFALRAKCLAR